MVPANLVATRPLPGATTVNGQLRRSIRSSACYLNTQGLDPGVPDRQMNRLTNAARVAVASRSCNRMHKIWHLRRR